MRQKNIEVHVYTTAGYRMVPFGSEALARRFALEQFERIDVYKVKVWDKDLGDIEPNNPKAKALILHLV